MADLRELGISVLQQEIFFCEANEEQITDD